MKTEDFERLKAVCEKEGYLIRNEDPWDGSAFVITKKDPWDGVLFARDVNTGKVHEIINVIRDYIIVKEGRYSFPKSKYVPSDQYAFDLQEKLNAPKDVWDGVEFAECVESSVSRFTEGKIYKVNPNGKGVDVCDFLIDNDYYPNGFVGSNREYFKPSTESAYKAQLEKTAFEKFGEIKEGDRFVFPEFLKCMEYEIDFPTVVQYVKQSDQLLISGYPVYSKDKWATRVKERVEVEPNAYSITQATDLLSEADTKKLMEFIAYKVEELINK